MLKKYLLLLAPVFAFGQAYYYPPVNSDAWAQMAPGELGWNAGRVDDLLDFVEAANTKAFIILKDGKIVVERYFGAFRQDSLWYWASAGKSLAGFLVGLAQEDGHLSIDDLSSQYLGRGWTSAPPEKEDRITILHQISMTTGLDDRGERALDNCLNPSCLIYLADAGTRWAYHNSPYHLVHDVVEKATGRNFTVYTRQRLGNRIGMKGLWYDYVYYSTARDMARFGLLTLSRGVWAGDTLMHDQNYFRDMLSPSQDLNRSYGYLWWLNGQASFMLPLSQVVFRRTLLPEAPADLVAALGKNDQKLYVVPSQGLVVVRLGNAASGSSPAALSSFDNQLWEKIGQLAGTTAAAEPAPEFHFSVYPNPTTGWLQIDATRTAQRAQLFDLHGRLHWQQSDLTSGTQRLDLPQLPAGTYLLGIEIDGQWMMKKIVLK